MTRFSLRRCSWLLLLALTGCEGGCVTKYTGQGKCENCQGQSFNIVTPLSYCSEAEVKKFLEAQCLATPGYTLTESTISSYEIFDDEACPGTALTPQNLLTADVPQHATAALRSIGVPVSNKTHAEAVSCSREKQFECDCFVERFPPGEQQFVIQEDRFCGDCANEVYREFYISELRHQCEVIYGGKVVSGFRCAEVAEGDFCPPTVTREAPTAVLKPIPDPKFADRQP